MPGSCDTGPPISRKIPGNKFNRAEFIRNSKHNLEFFAQVDRFNKINREKIVADYLNVVIDKSINLVNSFCDNFSSSANLKEFSVSNSNSEDDSNSKNDSTGFPQFSSILNDNSSLTLTPQKSSFLFSTAQFVKTFLSVFFCCLINFVKILLESLKKIIELFLHKFISHCKKCAKYLGYFCSALMPMPTLMLATPARGPPSFDTFSSGNLRAECKKCARDSFAPLLEVFMPQINQAQPSETGSNINLNMDITNNNNGTTYNSANMDIDAILSDVAEKIIQYNSNYATNTKEDVYSEWGYGIRGPPSGEVANGWDSILNTDTLELSHGPFGYDEWKSTNQDPFADTMALTISIPKSQLDFNDNGFSNEYEGITLTEVVKNDAFTAITTIGGTRNGNMFAYKANIPEPSLMGLAMIGVLGLKMLRGYIGKKRLS